MDLHNTIPLVLSLFLVACQSESTWKSQEMSTYCKASNSLRFTYPPQEPCEGFEVEFLFAQELLTCHFNLFLYPLPFIRCKEYPITFTAGTHTAIYPAYIHKGGQKLTLSQEAQTHFLSLLRSEASIQVSFKGHSQIIKSEGFNKLFDNNSLNHYQ